MYTVMIQRLDTLEILEAELPTLELARMAAHLAEFAADEDMVDVFIKNSKGEAIT